MHIAHFESKDGELHDRRTQVIVAGVMWSFTGQGCLLLLSFLATPYIVRRLTLDVYGIYALSGVVANYLGLFEFGMGAGVTKYISENLAKGDAENLANTFWGGVACATVGGCFAILGMELCAGWISTMLNVPHPVQAIAIPAFRITALSLCCSILGAITAGTLRAMGQFVQLNLIVTVMGIIQTGLMIALLWCGSSLIGVMWGNLACQAAISTLQFWRCFTVWPFLRQPRCSLASLKPLLRYGGVLTAGGIVAPILTHFEKFFLVRLTSIGLLGFYTVPFSLTEKLSVIPTIFGSVLFPSFSFYSVDGPRQATALRLLATRYVCVSVGFFAVFFVWLGGPFLDAWMGPQFAQKAALTLAILAVGGLLNSAARPAVTALQGMGRPQVPVLFNLAETVFYLPLAYILVRAFGINGAAWAWCIRVGIDALALHLACAWFFKEGKESYGKLLRSVAAPLGGCSVVFGLLRWSGAALTAPFTLLVLLITVTVYAALVWTHLLDQQTRTEIATYLRQLRGAGRHGIRDI